MLVEESSFDVWCEEVVDVATRTKLFNTADAVIMHYYKGMHMIGKSESPKGAVGVKRYINNWSTPI